MTSQKTIRSLPLYSSLYLLSASPSFIPSSFFLFSYSYSVSMWERAGCVFSLPLHSPLSTHLTALRHCPHWINRKSTCFPVYLLCLFVFSFLTLFLPTPLINKQVYKAIQISIFSSAVSRYDTCTSTYIADTGALYVPSEVR